MLSDTREKEKERFIFDAILKCTPIVKNVGRVVKLIHRLTNCRYFLVCGNFDDVTDDDDM